ncbi:MAG: hypothetical protein ACR2MP_25470 [Streptosporangiaceae bacterium]
MTPPPGGVSPAGLDYLNIHQHWHVTAWQQTPVVVFDDERAVLTALWEAAHLGWLRQPPALIRLDAHHDQWPLAAAREAAWREAVRRGDRREVCLAVEFDVGCDDADWVRAAAAASMITDVVTFYVTELPDPPPLPGARSLLLGGLGAELEPGGALACAGRDGGAPPGDVPGWDAQTCRFGADGLPYMLSTDLDAFSSTTGNGRPRSWAAADLEHELLAPRRRDRGTVRVADVLRGAAAGACLVTIAREPWYCGGDLEAARLLKTLDEVVFDGGIQA